MRRMFLSVLFTGIVALCLVNLVNAPIDAAAQDVATPAATEAALPECGNVVADAQVLIAKQCGSTGRNKICYGNISLKADPQPGISDFKFSEPGDVVNALDVKQLELSSLDINAGTWGMAMMRIQ